ncbi:unnamed protein product [Caenorhabditis bovis]|uniref:Homeobox domain-containing protein n=1 Tax=Caenorhabditis bovis TaxID=2654633 RepID=A0A8S1EQT7_9PELO|nr:unnamed protein product [Caenorhabditis bovis]
MYILVNVERHKHVMGEIVHNLVSEYGVPISIVDSIQKICPKCSASSSAAAAAGGSSSSSSSEDAKSDETTTENDGGTIPQETKPIIAKSIPSSRSSVVAEHNSEPKAKQRKIEQEATPELEDPSSSFTDVFKSAASFKDASILENAIANAFQNSRNNGLDKPFFPAKTSAGSDDGNSNSSNLDQDDDDYNSGLCINPQLLASFISSTPNIFATDLNLSTPTTPNNERKVPIKDIPPCLSTNGKFRRGRIVYTQNELDVLEKYYSEDPNACADLKKREQMCNLLNIDYHRLKVWFQNRRRKDKLRNKNDDEEVHEHGSLMDLLAA